MIFQYQRSLNLLHNLYGETKKTLRTLRKTFAPLRLKKSWKQYLSIRH